MKNAQGEKLETIKRLMREISKNWNEKDVLKYDSRLSFEELLSEIEGIFLK